MSSILMGLMPRRKNSFSKKDNITALTSPIEAEETSSEEGSLYNESPVPRCRELEALFGSDIFDKHVWKQSSPSLPAPPDFARTSSEPLSRVFTSSIPVLNSANGRKPRKSSMPFIMEDHLEQDYPAVLASRTSPLLRSSF
ncbi:MAG: hypothetical protein SGCHY_001403 [Lobulomycetales sp.]